MEEGNTRAQRRAGDDGGVNVQLGGIGQKYDRREDVTVRETSDGVTASRVKTDRGRENNKWTTDREETNNGTADRTLSSRRKRGTAGTGTPDRGNLDREMEGQRVG